MKVFVTGATGVIGRRAVARLIEAGHDVTAMARSPEKAARLDAAGARPATVSLFDGAALRTAVAGHDAVANLATHIPDMTKGVRASAWDENDRIRREGSTLLADAAIAAGVEAYVQESVTFGYANGDHRWLDEDAPLDLPPVVQATDVAEGNAARVATAGARGVTLRFAQFLAPDSSHVRDAVKTARRGWSPILGPPDGYGSWVHADDAAAAVVAALHAPTGVWNVAEDDPATRARQSEALARAVGREHLRTIPPGLLRLGGRTAGIFRRSQRVSNRRFKDATGWAPAMISSTDGWAAIVRATEAEHA
jgi:nucleoside-diphosphate-sugar epimerase